MKRAALVMLALAALAGAAWAQEPVDKRPGQPEQSVPRPERAPLAPQAESAGESGVWVGEKAPDFELDGSGGRPVRLSSLKGRWVLLVFDESRTKLADLKAIQAALDTLGVRPCGICRDGGAALKSFAERERLPYLLLSDLTGEVSQLYGMYDDDTAAIMPGIVLLDPKGVVRTLLLGQSLHDVEILQLVRHSVIGA